MPKQRTGIKTFAQLLPVDSSSLPPCEGLRPAVEVDNSRQLGHLCDGDAPSFAQRRVELGGDGRVEGRPTVGG
jgi:hypothetical protein